MRSGADGQRATAAGETPLARVLALLANVHPCGDGFTATCPAHEDRTPSLSIREGDGELVLLHDHGGCTVEAIVAALGLTMADLFPPNADGRRSSTAPRPRGASKGRIVAMYDYRDERGVLLFQVCRFDPKDFRQRRPRSARLSAGQHWLWNVEGVRRVLYRLPELRAADPAAIIFYPEGENDADNLAARGLVATTNAGGAGKWRPEYTDALRGRHVVVLPDNDKPGRAHAETVAAALVGIAASVKIVTLPNLPAKGDVSDWLAAGGTVEQLAAIVAAVPVWSQGAGDEEQPEDVDEGDTGGRKRPRRVSQATELLGLVKDDLELWHTPDGEAFATLTNDRHREHWPIRSSAIRHYLQRRFFEATERAIGSQAVEDARGVLIGRALQGDAHLVYVRVAGTTAGICIDLCDDAWRAVTITADGWRVERTADVRFRRTAAMAALPIPEPGGSLDELARFIPVAKMDPASANGGPPSRAWVLIIAWLVGAIRACGPYAVLELLGEQGSGKSTIARWLRALTDPSRVPLRAEPRDVRDLMIAATNGWCVALDNLSHLSPWLSDALCRLSTGGGFGTRQLYSDADEKLFDAMRPVILTGIEEVTTRGDLLDRTLLVHVAPLDDGQRRAEADLWRDFEAARPQLLGALYTAVARALRDEQTTTFARLPRMADFARWVVAAEPALGWSPGTFLQAYTENRAAAHDLALEGSMVATAIMKLMMEPESELEWTGTAGELLARLTPLVDEAKRRERDWPKSPRGLAGHLRRLAPDLRAIGLDVRDSRSPDRARARLYTIEKRAAQPSAPSAPSERESNPSTCKETDAGRSADGWTVNGRSADSTVRAETLDKSVRRTVADGADGREPTFSNASAVDEQSDGDTREQGDLEL